MFESEVKSLAGNRTRRVCLLRDRQHVSYAEFLRMLQDDRDFRSFFIALLANSPFPAYRWETPHVSVHTIGQPFEFVLLDSPWLDTQPDPIAFAGYFNSIPGGDGVVGFPNLGGDAYLVVPSPRGPDSAYGHLAAFVRGAPVAQVHRLWETVAVSLESRLGTDPVWMSTAGGGVPWVHVRLDSRPKYYGFEAYRVTVP